MRTTVHLDDRLFREIKRLAVDTHRTFTSILEDALRGLLARRRKSRRLPPADLPVFRGKGLQPGVDIDSASSLFDILEGRD